MKKNAIALAAACVLLASLPAFGQEEKDEKEPKKGGEDLVRVDFNNRTLGDFFTLVQMHTGMTFLYPSNLQGLQVFASGAREVTRKQLLLLFQSILDIHQHSFVQVPVWPGVVINKVLRTQLCRYYSGPTFSKDQIKADPGLLDGSSEMVNVIYPLRFAQAVNVQQALQQLMAVSQSGIIMGIPNVEVLVITDFAPNVQRMVQIMDLMDVPGPSLEMDLIRLEHAPVDKLLPILQQLSQVLIQYQQQRRAGQPVQDEVLNLVVDERTNGLILQGSPGLVAGMKQLISELDVPLDFEPSGIHMYRLKHTDAEQMSATINDLLRAVPLSQLGAALPGLASSAVAPAFAEGAPPQPALPASARQQAEDEIKVAAIPDKVTNSVIVVAGDDHYRVIERIIESLDVSRPQVLIEVGVLEISEGEGFNLGVELTTLDGARDGSTRGFAATRFGFSNLMDRDGKPLSGSGMPGGQFPVSTQGAVFGAHRGKEWRIPALLSLIGSDSNVNVVSLPRIVTNDNQEAELKVLDQVPTASSSSTAAVSNQVSFGGFQEAGITLKLTPHISDGGYLRLEIFQKISQFTGTSQVISAGGTVVGVLPPGKTERELRNVITVPDGRTVIIGGLTSKSRQTTVSKVPFLGDIPLLGELFRKTSSDWRRTNLYVFITPHIIEADRPEKLGAMSDVAARDASRLGSDLSLADRHWRSAFGADDALQSLPEGRTSSRLTFARPGRREGR